MRVAVGCGKALLNVRWKGIRLDDTVSPRGIAGVKFTNNSTEHEPFNFRANQAHDGNITMICIPLHQMENVDMEE